MSTNLFDVHGEEIFEDDLLTFDWFADISETSLNLLNIKYNGDIEAITEYFMTPVFRVTRTQYGFQGVDINYNRNLKLYPDRFKYTRKIKWVF